MSEVMNTPDVSEKQVKRAIRDLDRAWRSLEPLSGENPSHGVHQLRSDINEYVDYLERATWWRKQ